MRAAVLALTLIGGASSASAAPEDDLVRQAALADRFTPFDAAAGADWEAAFPTPFFRAVAANQNDAVPFQLKTGSYRVVVLCNCDLMDVTLVNANGEAVQPERSSDQAAMYSLDAKDETSFLAGIDMGDCDEDMCGVAVKVYRKK